MLFPAVGAVAAAAGHVMAGCDSPGGIG